MARLRCPACGAGELSCSELRPGGDGAVRDGVVGCTSCDSWFPIEDSLLDLLVGDLAYGEDRQRFWTRWEGRLRALGLRPDREAPERPADQQLQLKQQQHFDWYGDNDRQSYTQFQEMPFWRAVDRIAYAPWRQQIRPGSWLVDVGCAQGRSTFNLLDLDIHVVAFDVSKVQLREAVDRYRRGSYRARASFMAADACRFPLAAACFDYALITGVLHHLPDPATACREVARVLETGGSYFGYENNRTFGRALFDLLHRLWPLWHEEAGPDPLISARDLETWFSATAVEVETRSSVFLPPQLINLLPAEKGYRLLSLCDRLAGSIPVLRDAGGLILIHGTKRQGREPSASHPSSGGDP